MLDQNLIFDGTLNATTGVPAGVAITASATTVASTNILDLLVARDLGVDDYAELHVDVTVAFTTTNSATLSVAFQTCATTNGTYVTLLQSVAYPAAQLIAGAPIFRYAVPLNQELNSTAGILAAPGRYLRMLYTVGTGVFTTGSVFTYLNAGHDRQQFWVPPNNYTAYVAPSEI